jgi:hypothetical protein
MLPAHASHANGRTFSVGQSNLSILLCNIYAVAEQNSKFELFHILCYKGIKFFFFFLPKYIALDEYNLQ